MKRLANVLTDLELHRWIAALVLTHREDASP